MTEQQKDFVQMYLKHNCKITAHNLAYGNNSNIASVESSANRLLRIPEIAETIRSIQDNIRHEVEQEFKAKYREELMSIYEKRLLLKKIATGEMYVEQKYKGKNCTQCSQYISPTINQMLAAIREDNKLAGHYPHKQNGKWVIPALQTGQEQETELSPAAVPQPPQVDGAGRSLPADGGGTLVQDPEISRPGACPAELLEGIGGERPQDEKDNNRQHSDTYRDTTTENQEISPLQGDLGVDSRHSNPPENPQQITTIEELSPAGGGVSLSADEGGLLAQDTREKDPSERMFIRAGNKRQHPDSYRDETTIDNQSLVENNTDDSISLPFRGIGGQLLYPKKPKLSYMKNNP